MNEQLQVLKGKFAELYGSYTTKQKAIAGATFLFLVISLSLWVYFASRPEFVPLFRNSLSVEEVGQVKAELESKGVQFKLSEDGRNILVPRKDAPGLTVDLAAAGLPKGSNISLDIFENMGFGITERQFDVAERDVLQNHLAKLIKGFSGVTDSRVMITLPKEQLFLSNQEGTATASILLQLEPGMKLDQKKINTLYHFVSKTVPNLPIENIVITDQYSNMMEYVNAEGSDIGMTAYEQQRSIERRVQEDIQRDLLNMLGTIIGMDKVYVYTKVRLNFDKVKEDQRLFEPVDEENQEGIAIMVEKIQKTFSGTNAEVGGVPGTGETDVPQYPGGAQGQGKSEMEEVEERVNREVNRITRDIVRSPYFIEDLTINVGVDLPADSPDAETTKEAIEEILKNVVRSAISKEVDDNYIADRIKVVAQPFQGKPEPVQMEDNTLLYYALAALAGAIMIGGIVYFIMRRKRKRKEEDTAVLQVDEAGEKEIPDLEYTETEEVMARKQLEKLAKQRPEEFANLLRVWLQED
ncbi:flagellar basal-body MS-ring/collar protein FliF [Ammoniphilus sp. CFH 90114]|uniref:flagellar basal-body MS-ring/collar protein FliF n=1 Tax=Ammoniphilus sp. CFH 90114 TaxID=2493665 RepID=UPI00100DFD2E|nr:flagellar basal-body MS-ring/collar protein FliF [Ammoniphilus sp. CFH 90114]RXT15112.1 flagellar M-ring protein FliF [Ammoniphilus sp. CFH 90114]